MRDASQGEAILFETMVQNRNAEGLLNLVKVRFPEVLWGKVTQSLSLEDRQWVMSSLSL